MTHCPFRAREPDSNREEFMVKKHLAEGWPVRITAITRGVLR